LPETFLLPRAQMQPLLCVVAGGRADHPARSAATGSERVRNEKRVRSFSKTSAFEMKNECVRLGCQQRGECGARARGAHFGPREA
jgi:hypothetical protein